MPTRLWSVVFDTNDPAALASFWADTLGWQPKRHAEFGWSVSQDEGFLPRLEFVSVPEPKMSKNRVHFDLACESESRQEQIVERLIGLGARHVDIGQPADAPWFVLADPEGNEFCVPRATARIGTGPIYAIAYDALDGATLGRFWSSATGWPIVREFEHIVVLRSPNSSGPIITVSGPPERVAPKPVKNRIHLDIAPFHVDDQAIEVERLISLGARRIDIGQGDVPWVVLADPEDNEFCVLTPL